MLSRTNLRIFLSPRLYLFLGIGLVLTWIVAVLVFGFGRGPLGKDAPDFQGIHRWINTEPLSLEDLRGKVVLVDFWTYTCINCIRTLPYLKDWHGKYADSGLVIVGVHSPEFEFEKLTENVTVQAAKLGVAYPIAQDNDFETWRAYKNNYWPAKYLVDKEGVVRYNHFGEGAYLETEEKIRELLLDAGADLRAIEPGTTLTGAGADASASRSRYLSRLTRELYGGYERNAGGGNYIAHEEYYDGPERVVDYPDAEFYQNNKVYLKGPWLNGPESIKHARKTDHLQDYIGIRFSAASVNVVANPRGDARFQVDVTIDGLPLTPEQAGQDIDFADGRSFFTVTEGRMYGVVSLPVFSSHELRLSSNSDDFAVFAFTFGV